jgi:formylglycine-generating enzyme required for sulfatase activity
MPMASLMSPRRLHCSGEEIKDALLRFAGLLAAVALAWLPVLGMTEESASTADSAPPPLTPYQRRAIREIESSMMPIAGNCFEMGTMSREVERIFGVLRMRAKPVPRGNVCLKNYRIGAVEITQGQWLALMGDNPSFYRHCGARCPVERVSWDDVQIFIELLNRLSGAHYRLPTDAEWEFAARGKKSTDFSTGKCITSLQANFDGTQDFIECDTRDPDDPARTRGMPLPVASFEPNAYGLYDMHGNVAEWMLDCWQAPIKERWPGNLPLDLPECTDRVVRGGGWSSAQISVRSSARDRGDAASRFSSVGFRLVREK